MRKLISLASFVALVMASCTNETPAGDANAKGSVVFDLAIQTEVDDTRSNINCTTPAVEAFKLTIEGVNHTYKKEYATIAEFNENDNYLHIGTYRATVTAGDITIEGYDVPTFIGSAEFSVSARENTEVEITATIANALVKVETTDAFNNYFVGGAKFELTTNGGNKFDVTEQTEPLFIAPEEFVVNGTATKQPNQSGAAGVEVTLPEYKMEAPAAKTFYTIKFDVTNAGGASLEITLNDTLADSIALEDVELNDNAK